MTSWQAARTGERQKPESTAIPSPADADAWSAASADCAGAYIDVSVK